MTTLKFPEKFYWGAATSAHQVEGNNHNDWSEWEKQNAARLAQESAGKFGHLAHWERLKPQAENPQNYISGLTCDHYHRFREDFDIAQSLHQNAHRFSVEWSRIEPEEGQFNEEAIEHYRTVISALRERGIEPFVTLWHWTNPLWLAEKGGPETKEFAVFFERYVRFVVTRLRGQVKFWVTLNEPTSVIGAAYVAGTWPPQKKSLLAAYRVFHTLAAAHKRAYHAIHAIDNEAQVGFANVLQSFVPYRKKFFIDSLSVHIARFLTDKYMLRLTRGHHDFLTAQYYFHTRLKFITRTHNVDHPESDLGWEIYPEGLYHILKWLEKFHLPIYITENGLADAPDEKRTAFIREHLRWVHRAIEEGADVRGYFYWSLLDNFEWDKGFWPRFGLVAIDYPTQKRTVRQSALAYAKICQTNALELPDTSIKS
ncbi:MAG: glycoside hydrolase family 1 protein [Candidatus Moraniibacteriota bacterium]